MTLGEIPAVEIQELTGGRLNQAVPVRLNRLILDYDHILICGPVFPHEVVGFSGGAKYFFPGIAGPEIIHFTHWLGALITSYEIIGTPETAVRAVINRAVELVDRPHSLLALVAFPEGVAGVYCGPTLETWAEAAKLSAQRHIVWVEKPFQRVLSIMPPIYRDLWTGAKGMYKLEPVVADGGEVVIYAPHIQRGELRAREADRRNRLSLPGLFHRAVGPVRDNIPAAFWRTRRTSKGRARTIRPAVSRIRASV